MWAKVNFIPFSLNIGGGGSDEAAQLELSLHVQFSGKLS